ncbi:MAG TPA: ABC transporter permease [Polyangiaceae bacterium]|nr:ABC transporter permease [Polyangiaceae bacterium]
MLVETLRMALSELWAHRLRSGLTSLSITVGAFTIVFMSSLAESGLKSLVRSIDELGGGRMLLVSPKEPDRAAAKGASYERGLRPADRDAVLGGLRGVEAATLSASKGEVDVVAASGKRARSDLVGADAGFFDAFRMGVREGRRFTEAEDRDRQPLCVVGPGLVEKLGAPVPLGSSLDAGPLRCRVVGVFDGVKRFGIDFDFDWRNLVVVPLGALDAADAATPQSTMLSLRSADDASYDLVKRMLNARLVERRHGVDDFLIYDLRGVVTRFNAVFAIMEAIVALLAGVALVIGGVGVMNMMLVSVSERVREIGLRKALGASPAVIGRQFLAEAMLLSLAGGGLGAAAGAACALGASRLIVKALPAWLGVVSAPALVAAPLTALALGAAFKQALGDKVGIYRFGNCTVPLDESLAQVTVDLSGRPYLVHTEPEKMAPMIGEYDTTMTRHILESFVAQAQIALHVHVPYGRNAHHIVECQFKALARALRYASERDPRAAGILPSTKGAL